MFDGSLPEIDELAVLDDAALVDAAAGWAQAENAACARKLAVMAEQFARRTGLAAAERELWWADPEAAVGAELGAAQNISTWMALAQAHRGVVLADRLPKVAALFAAGLISEPLVRAIEYRTGLVTDDEAIARVDGLLADHVLAWGPLSVRKTEQAIDAIVDQVDPGALRRARTASRRREVSFGSPSDQAGYTSMWALMYGPDAEVVKQRVEQMARSVCEADPRTLGERRSEALAAIGAGLEALACRCGNSDCPAAHREATAAATAVIHVVAHAATVEAAHAESNAGAPPDPIGDDAPVSTEPGDTAGSEDEDVAAQSDTDDSAPAPAADPAGSGSEGVAAGSDADDVPGDPAPVEGAEHAVVPPALCPAPPAEQAVTPMWRPLPVAEPPVIAPRLFAAPPADSTTTAAAGCPAPPAFVIGGGVLPVPLLAATLERATVRQIVHPGDSPPEPHYAPSRKLADFVRCRDLTCRFPGCDRPATQCDLDHTVPYPVGPTHASNIKCLCRFHHLIKTFWGWLDRQSPDGTVIWTAPTGHTYTTKPGSALLFPALCLPTGELHLPEHTPTANSDQRGAMMPRRRHTRAENLARRIEAERKLNDDHFAERNRPPPF